MKYYSATTNGFYSPDVHTTFPADAVEITDELWQSLLQGQSQGKVITASSTGTPVLADPPAAEPQPEPTAEEKLQRAGLSVDDLRSLLGL